MGEEIKLPTQELQSVIQALEVNDVFLTGSTFELKKHPNEIKPDNTRLHVETATVYEIREDRKVFLCNVTRTIDAFPKDTIENNEQNRVFRISASFAIVYVMNEKEGSSLSEFALKIFSETNAEFNTYTYFREFIHSICMRSGLEPIVLPFHRPLSPKQINEKYKSQLNEVSNDQKTLI